MQLTKSISRPARGGYALIVTLAFLIVALAAYASLMYWVSTNAKITKRNILFTQSEGAAESATEIAVAYMMRDFYNQSLNSASTYSTNLPMQTGWPVTYQFSTTNGTANAITINIGSTNWSQLPSQFAGLLGLGQTCDIIAQATPQSTGENLGATVDQQIWFGSIPIFQFAIFYNLDLEINPGAGMTINGRVHSNNNIYATGSGSGASALTFSTTVDASGQVYTTPDPLDPGNTAAGRSGNVVFTDTTQNPLSDVKSLSLPIGTNNNPATVIGILGIPPAGTVASSPTGQSYPYNQADIIITNSASGTNLFVYYQNLNSANPHVLVPMDVTNISVSYITNKNTPIAIYSTNTYYSFVTNATFYDYRESDQVQAIQIDVAKFGKWMTNATGGLTYNNLNDGSGSTSKGHNIDGVYVYNSVAPASGSPGILPAVRLVNGQQLPSADGFSVATPFPIYVEGNYNTTTNGGVNSSITLGDTTNTWPAALMGDAITILSPNWSDAWNSGTTITTRNIPNTTTTVAINAATLEGIVPSNGTYYSGGVENFLRLEEDWGGVTLAYNGSIVVLFQSQYATSPWPGTGTVYNPPTRRWGFDTNFKSQGNLPPMTPQLRAAVRNSWAAW